MLEVFTYEQLPERIRDALQAGARRLICPKCRGGEQREVSLSVKDLPGEDLHMLGLYCWRASCGWRANVLCGESRGDLRLVRQQVHEGRVFERDVESCTRHGIAGLLDVKYDLRPPHYAGKWKAYTDTDPDGTYWLVMEVRGPAEELRGHVARTFAKNKRVMAYKASAQPWLDWWLSPNTDKLYIVEDQISACKIHVALGSAVALLGTNMTLDKAREIKQICERYDMEPILWLDEDAYGKAVKIQERYRHMLKTSTRMSKLDPKDIKFEDLHV